MKKNKEMKEKTLEDLKTENYYLKEKNERLEQRIEVLERGMISIRNDAIEYVDNFENGGDE